MTFWHTATDEAKLAQIKAAQELGLTATQCAMNLGTRRENIFYFFRAHGFRYGLGEQAKRKAAEGAREFHLKKNPGGNWSTKDTIQRSPADLDEALIFQYRTSYNLFDPLPYDGEAFQ